MTIEALPHGPRPVQRQAMDQRQAREPFAPIRPAKLGATAAAKGVANEPARPPGGLPAGADDGAAVTQALKALQQRGGATTPLSDN